MRKPLILSTFLLLCAVWAGAQTSGSSGSSAQQPSSSSGSMSQSSSDNAQTVQGCLSGSAGNFSLISSSGTTYQLAGDTSKLSDHVGEQVEITGTAASGSASSSGTSPSGTSPSASSGASAGAGQTINVQSVKKIASSCNTPK